MIQEPENIQVVVTNNLFGDIVTDLGAALQGGLGMAPSANINPSRPGPALFEPVHGSAPPLAGKNLANPFAAALTVGMMLEHLGHHGIESLIEDSVRACVVERQCTKDVGGTLGTTQTMDRLLERLNDRL